MASTVIVFFVMQLVGLFLAEVVAAVAFVELLHAAGRVQQLLLPGVERMAGAGDIHTHQRVFFAVFPLNFFVGSF